MTLVLPLLTKFLIIPGAGFLEEFFAWCLGSLCGKCFGVPTPGRSFGPFLSEPDSEADLSDLSDLEPDLSEPDLEADLSDFEGDLSEPDLEADLSDFFGD